LFEQLGPNFLLFDVFVVESAHDGQTRTVALKIERAKVALVPQFGARPENYERVDLFRLEFKGLDLIDTARSTAMAKKLRR
jgi:hypothetical protein